MRPRTGDAAAEDQRAVRVVENGLPGGHHTEPRRLDALVVTNHADAGKARRRSPEVGLLPIQSEAVWFLKDNVGPGPPRRAGEDLRELTKARARAGTLRVCEKDQRRSI